MRFEGGEAEEERLRGGDRLRDREGVRDIPPRVPGDALPLREDRRGDRRCGADVGEMLREALLETLLDALRERVREGGGDALRERTLADDDLRRVKNNLEIYLETLSTRNKASGKHILTMKEIFTTKAISPHGPASLQSANRHANETQYRDTKNLTSVSSTESDSESALSPTATASGSFAFLDDFSSCFFALSRHSRQSQGLPSSSESLEELEEPGKS